jgi:hypothetical protein
VAERILNGSYSFPFLLLNSMIIGRAGGGLQQRLQRLPEKKYEEEKLTSSITFKNENNI